MARIKALRHNIKQVFISLDQFIGCLIAVLCCLLPFMPYWLAWADETMSAKAYLWHTQGIRNWPRSFIDFLANFFRDFDHCKQSYESEIRRSQSPPECR